MKNPIEWIRSSFNHRIGPFYLVDPVNDHEMPRESTVKESLTEAPEKYALR